MASSTKWRINVSADNGNPSHLAIGDVELRTVAGVPRPFSLNTFGASVVDSGAASLQGIAALSTISGYSTSFQEVDFPFTVYFGGVGYTKCFVSPYGYIYFDTAGAAWGYERQNTYTDLSGKDPAVPHIILAGTNSASNSTSIHALYAGAENSGTTFRIRMEMNAGSTDVTPGVTIWEVSFDSAAPNTMRIDFGTCGIIGGQVAAIGDGKYKNYRATLPTVSNKQYNVTTYVTTADGTATDSSHLASVGSTYYTADQATDADTNTWWGANAATGWWQYEYLTPQEIAQYIISAPSVWLGDPTAPPQDWTLEYWDGAAWVVADTRTGQTGWTDSEARTFTLPSNDGAITFEDLTAAGLLSVPDNTLVGIEMSIGELSTDGVVFINDGFGVISLPSATVSATGYPHQMSAGGDLAIAPPTLEGSLEGPLPLPLMTLDATGVSGTTSIGVMRIQSLVMNPGGSMEPAMPLPELDVAGEMISGGVAAANISMASPDAAGACLVGGIGIGDVSLPLLGAEGGREVDISLPLFDVVGQAVAGNVGAGSITMSRMVAVADGAIAYADGIADGQIELTEWSISAAGDSSSVISGSVTLSAASVSASGAAGNICAGALTMPLMTISADGFADIVGTASIAIPLLSVEAVMQSAAPAPVFTSVVLNTQTKAASTYAGLGINSMANFGGMTLAATASGIVALIGDSDDGAPIDAMVAGGVSDLNSERYKRVLCAYVGYRADGDLEMTMITDQHHEFIYQLAPRQLDHAHASRVKLGRGIQGRYWQWKLTNKTGAAFAMDAVTLDVQPLSRRTA